MIVRMFVNDWPCVACIIKLFTVLIDFFIIASYCVTDSKKDTTNLLGCEINYGFKRFMIQASDYILSDLSSWRTTS
jgi:hypothetical protein